MIFGSLFSGIEAASCAFLPLGWRCAWTAEIDPFASAVLRHHYPDVPNLGDITEIDWNAVEPVDLVGGGPPCQGFSIAGQRGGLSDPRGNLSLAYVRALDAIDPVWCLTENVPGWLSMADNSFGHFLGRLVGADAALVPAKGQRWTDAGVVAGPRRTAAWRILDAQYFGVPQRRRRVFVLACRGAGDLRCAEALFPQRQSVQRDSAPRREARENAAAGAGDGSAYSLKTPSGGGGWRGDGANNFVAFGGNNTSGPIEVATACNAHGGSSGRLDFETETLIAFWAKDHGADAGNIALTLRAGGHDRSHANAGVMPAIAFQSNAGRDFTADHDRSPRAAGAGGTGGIAIAHALRADGFDASEDGTGRGTPLVAVDWQNSAGGPWLSPRPRMAVSAPQPGDPCHPLAATAHPPAIAGMSVRRLLPIETERLQGLPDNYTLVPYRGKPAADGNRYRAVGNSFAVPVVAWLGRRIQLVEDTIRETSDAEA